MANLDPAVARARFAVFVDRALKHARDNGLTDRKIHAISGVGTTTFHRWRKGDGLGLPEIEKVRAFVAATGANLDDAMDALGMTENARKSTPEPPLSPEVKIILRRLADPNTPETEREFIRMSLQMLAGRAAGVTRRDEQAVEDAG